MEVVSVVIGWLCSTKLVGDWEGARGCWKWWGGWRKGGLFKLLTRAPERMNFQCCSSPQWPGCYTQNKLFISQLSKKASFCHHRCIWFLIWVCQIRICTVKRFFKSTVMFSANRAHKRSWSHLCRWGQIASQRLLLMLFVLSTLQVLETICIDPDGCLATFENTQIR